MTPPDVTAADLVEAAALYEGECPHFTCWYARNCVRCMATALATVRAEQANAVENWKQMALRNTDVAGKYMARVTTLEAALRNMKHIMGTAGLADGDVLNEMYSAVCKALATGAGGTA